MGDEGTDRSRGRFLTPSAVVDRLVTHALVDAASSVADPACGDGRFLRAAAARGRHHLFGGDVVPIDAPACGGTSFVVANTLLEGRSAWPDAPAEGFDLVIGNPPFRGQLQAETWLKPEERTKLVAKYGSELARGYVDTASLFLVAACEMAAPTGRVAFIMPLSFLAARDAAPARRRVLELATLEGLWICPDFVFPDAQVQVCAVILDRAGPRRRPVRRWVGEAFDPIAPAVVDSDQLIDAPTWSHLAAPAFDIPEVHLPERGTLGELVSATAGFREQFYGLAPLVTEHPGDGTDHQGLAPLVTSGLIDPGSVAWGERPARMGGTTWARPAVDLTRLDPTTPLGRWVEQRRRPKLVVATQTKAIEAAPDPTGALIPSTPVIAAHADGDDLWRALAVLLAPPVTAWARARYTGAALSATAIKLSARQVEGVPLPVDSNRWAAAADLLVAAHQRHGRLGLDDLRAVGEHMTIAYGCDPSITEWWSNLL